MFAEERKKAILNLLEIKKRVSVNELSEEFEVSRATIRRDLSELEKKGFLRRTHGGAILSGSSKLEPSFEEKEERYAEEKRKIGKKSAEMIKDGDTIFLDAGTTSRYITEYLGSINDLTIVTHALHIIKRIKEIELDCELVVVGGNFKWTTEAMVGPMAEDFLKDLRVDKAFVGANGFNINDGATTPDPKEGKMKEIALEIAAENFLIFDRSKWEEVYFFRFAEAEEVDFIITDSIDKKKEEILNQNNTKIITSE